MPHAINPAPAATKPAPAGVFHERAEGSVAAMIGTGEVGGSWAGNGTGAATATDARFSTGSSTIATDTLAPPAILTVFEKSLKPALLAITTALPSTSLTDRMKGNVPTRLPSIATSVPIGPVTTSAPM